MRKYVFNQYSISSFLSNKLIISSNNVGIFQLNLVMLKWGICNVEARVDQVLRIWQCNVKIRVPSSQDLTVINEVGVSKSRRGIQAKQSNTFPHLLNNNSWKVCQQHESGWSKGLDIFGLTLIMSDSCLALGLLDSHKVNNSSFFFLLSSFLIIRLCC